MPEDNYSLLPDSGRDMPPENQDKQGCMDQIKRGIPILLILTVMTVAFLVIIGGVIAYGSGFYDNYMAQRELQKKNFKKAVEYSDRSIAKNQKNSMAYLIRGAAYLELNKFDKALSDFNRAVDLNPSYAPAFYARGLCRLKMNKLEDSLVDFNRAIKMKSDFGMAYYNRGIVYLRMGKNEEAIKDLDESEKYFDDLPGVYALRGGIYADMGEYEKALTELNKAAEVSPGNPLIFSQRASIYGKMGEFDKSMKDFDKAIQLDPENKSIYRNRASIYWKQGKYKEASEDLTKAIELEPDEVYHYIWKHIMMKRAGEDPGNSLAEFNKNNKDEKWPKPVVEMLLEEITPEECLKKAESENPRLDKEQKCEAHFYVSQYNLIKGDRKKAKENLEKCIEQNVKYFYEHGLAQSELEMMNDESQ